MVEARAMSGSVTPAALCGPRWSVDWTQTPQEGCAQEQRPAPRQASLSACTGPAPGAPADISECVHRAGAWRPGRRLLSFIAVVLAAVRTAVVLAALLCFQTYARVSAVILSTSAVLGHVSFPSALPLACHCSVFITAPCLTFKLYHVISKLACLTAGWET